MKPGFGGPRFFVLLAEDDGNDVLLVKRAFQKTAVKDSLRIVRDGQEAINYLMGEGKYSDRNEYPFPTILLTDLKMPKLDGLEVLQWIKEHENCRVIPTIIFSASAQLQDVEKAYALGANSYVQKPSTFEELTILFASLLDYWGRCVVPLLTKECS